MPQKNKPPRSTTNSSALSAESRSSMVMSDVRKAGAGFMGFGCLRDPVFPMPEDLVFTGMDPSTDPHLAALKIALKTLKNSGPDGFGGLRAAVTSEVCGQPFRLASSGSRRGRDGNSAFDDGATYFEAKL